MRRFRKTLDIAWYMVQGDVSISSLAPDQDSEMAQSPKEQGDVDFVLYVA